MKNPAESNYPESTIVYSFERALLALDKSGSEEILFETVKNGSPVEIATNLVTATLRRIGLGWEEGRLSLSQVYMSGIICEEIIDKLLPPSGALRKDQPKMAIGVFEDYHLLGKRIIYSTLRASGFELVDLGGGLQTPQLVKMVSEQQIKILLLSVLMLPSALRIRELKTALGNQDVKIVVGGAPFRLDDQLWEEVGADAMGKDSSDAIRIVTGMIGGEI